MTDPTETAPKISAQNLASALHRFTGGLRSLLKVASPDAYAQYRLIKYPDTTKASATPETKLEAARFIFAETRRLLVVYEAPVYVAPEPDEEDYEEDDEEDEEEDEEDEDEIDY